MSTSATKYLTMPEFPTEMLDKVHITLAYKTRMTSYLEVHMFKIRATPFLTHVPLRANFRASSTRASYYVDEGSEVFALCHILQNLLPHGINDEFDLHITIPNRGPQPLEPPLRRVLALAPAVPFNTNTDQVAAERTLLLPIL